MAYDPTSVVNVPSAITEGGINATLAKLWLYSSDDTDVSGTYFTDGQTRGMRVGDLVIATDTTTPQVNLHRVTALAAIDLAHPGAIRAATLSVGVKIGN